MGTEGEACAPKSAGAAWALGAGTDARESRASARRGLGVKAGAARSVAVVEKWAGPGVPRSGEPPRGPTPKVGWGREG